MDCRCWKKGKEEEVVVVVVGGMRGHAFPSPLTRAFLFLSFSPHHFPKEKEENPNKKY